LGNGSFPAAGGTRAARRGAAVCQGPIEDDCGIGLNLNKSYHQDRIRTVHDGGVDVEFNRILFSVFNNSTRVENGQGKLKIESRPGTGNAIFAVDAHILSGPPETLPDWQKCLCVVHNARENAECCSDLRYIWPHHLLPSASLQPKNRGFLADTN